MISIHSNAFKMNQDVTFQSIALPPSTKAMLLKLSLPCQKHSHILAKKYSLFPLTQTPGLRKIMKITLSALSEKKKKILQWF